MSIDFVLRRGLTAELSGVRIMSGANWKFAQRVMRIPLELFVTAARISTQATIKVESCLIFILYFLHSGKKLLKR